MGSMRWLARASQGACTDSSFILARLINPIDEDGPLYSLYGLGRYLGPGGFCDRDGAETLK